MGADGARRVWQIEGVEREAIVHLPTGAPHPCPVILAFHGHGGRAQSVQRSMHFQDEWPEAVVVYPQGLATKTARDPAGARAGWQNRPGENDDRDLKLVDQIMASLRASGWVDDHVSMSLVTPMAADSPMRSGWRARRCWRPLRPLQAEHSPHAHSPRSRACMWLVAQTRSFRSPIKNA